MKSSKQSPSKRANNSNNSTLLATGRTTPNSNKQSRAKDATVTKGSNPLESICDICAQNVPGPEREKIFAFGRCDHFVCYVCSARLRAICDRFECPICRETLDEVILACTKDKPFEKYCLKDCIRGDKYRIYFETKTIQSAFEKLLKYECLECAKIKPTLDVKKDGGGGLDTAPTAEFPGVLALKNHLHLVHRLKLCDLCLTHNNLFPFEYSYYDQAYLKKHVRDGEPNTSHRGHPNCSLCHQTFFNPDELLQHMSREHFHCHLCGRYDSNMRIYFRDYESLRQHFKDKHFLCERENCRHEQFTSAFESRIDYQMHLVQVHGRGEARQQRTITLDAAPHRAHTSRSQHDVGPNGIVITTGPVASANNPRQQIPENIRVQLSQQRLPSRYDFPALDGNQSIPYYPSGASSSSTSAYTSTNLSGVNYPSLVPPSCTQQPSRMVSTSQRLVARPSCSRGGTFVETIGGGSRTPAQLNEMEFPPLPEQPKSKSTTNSRPKTPNQSKARVRNEDLTLDQLISHSLSLSSRNHHKNKGNKSNKSTKPKALKIQL